MPKRLRWPGVSVDDAAVIFGEAGWPAFRFFADASAAGHRFGLLPVGRAIHWLEAQTTDDPARLLDFAERCMKTKGGYRDAVAALNRGRALKLEAALGADGGQMTICFLSSSLLERNISSQEKRLDRVLL